MFSRVPNLPKIWKKNKIKIHISIGIYNENVNLGPGMFPRVPNLPKIWWKQIKIHKFDESRLKFTFPSVFTMKMWIWVQGCSLVFQIFLKFDESRLKFTFPSVFTMKMWILAHGFFLISPVFFQITFSSQIFFRLLFQVRFFSDFFSDYFFKSDFFSDCFFKSDFFSHSKSDFFQKLIISRIWAYGWWWTLLYLVYMYI